MKKLIGLLLVISTFALALNFHGHQSLNGLGYTRIFTAPANALYFVKGLLSLPMSSQNNGDGNSGAGVVVYKNGSTVVYQGVSGATGFTIPALALISGDYVTVSISSNATIDQGLNVIKGDVFFGNAM